MSQPTLILMDIQREYTTAGRPFYMQGIAPSLSNAKRLLDQARAHGWSVIHVQHLQNGPVFNLDGEYGAFVPGFEPEHGEAHVIKSKLSAYTNVSFQMLIDAALARGTELIVAGYGSTMCCLATVTSGALFGHRYTFVHDASWARSSGPECPEAEVHRYATATLGLHAKIASTGDILETAWEKAA
jgi:ureidoacrylate peracid hydrolase